MHLILLFHRYMPLQLTSLISGYYTALNFSKNKFKCQLLIPSVKSPLFNYYYVVIFLTITRQCPSSSKSSSMVFNLFYYRYMCCMPPENREEVNNKCFGYACSCTCLKGVLTINSEYCPQV